MVRVAWTARLRPNKVDAYLAVHQAVPADVLAAIRAAGISDYSCFLIGDRVFGTYECEDAETSLTLEASAEATKLWRLQMADLFEESVASDGPTFLPEIFRLD